MKKKVIKDNKHIKKLIKKIYFNEHTIYVKVKIELQLIV